MKKLTLCLLVLFSTSLLYAEDGYITICSFNIAELGASRENKDHRAIADMIDDFDLIGVQEVQDNGGEEHIMAIVDSLNVDSSNDYSYITLDGAGRGFPGNEGYAFIYRDPVESDHRYEPHAGLKETDVPYGRKPGWAYFKADDFDFMVVAVHLHWSNLDKRTAEVADLLAWLKEFTDRPESEERDLILVGDFNRFGDYSNTKINNRETAFHQLLDDPALGDKYRLIFCEHLSPEIDVRILDDTLEEDIIATSSGDLKITRVGHGSLYFTFSGKVIHVDPYGSLTDYSGLPKADLIFITHDHSDHLDTGAIDKIKTDTTVLVYTEKCAEQLEGGTVMRNSDTQTIEGINIEAVPAYNIVHTRPDGNPYHPTGEGNGYIFTFGDKRVYVAGDTENTPEMKALADIDVAFLPMNLPYTMTPEMVADATVTFLPKILYPYHYGNTDTNELLNIFDSLSIFSKESYVDDGSTTVSDNNNMVYDQIIISQGAFYEFGNAKASLRDNLGDDDGTTVGIETDDQPSEFKVSSSYPNPFNPTTTIQYEIPEANHVKLVIYDILGREVTVLQDGMITAGVHNVVWDGRNRNGELTSSGVYIYQLMAGDHKAKGKVLFLR